MHVITILRSLRQVDHKLETNLEYILVSCLKENKIYQILQENPEAT